MWSSFQNRDGDAHLRYRTRCGPPSRTAMEMPISDTEPGVVLQLEQGWRRPSQAQSQVWFSTQNRDGDAHLRQRAEPSSSSFISVREILLKLRFSTSVFCPSRGHVALPGETLVVINSCQEEVRHCAKHPTMHRTDPTSHTQQRITWLKIYTPLSLGSSSLEL